MDVRHTLLHTCSWPCSCGECLGLLGALDPARVSPARRAPPDLVDPELEAARRATKGGAAGAAGTEAGGRYALALALVQDHLVGAAVGVG